MKTPFDLAAGSTDLYVDATWYDDEYKDRTEDVRWYVDRYVEAGEPVLELGVGSGRIALKAVRKGARVVGLDLSQDMLDQAALAQSKLPKSRQPNLELVQGDMRDFDLGRRFGLITCPFNAFQHLYTREDVEACLARIRAHLKPDGVFIVDVLVPDLEYLMRPAFRTFEGIRFKHATHKVHYTYSEKSAYDPNTQVNQMWFMMDRDPGLEVGPERIEMQLSHRCFFPRELEALMHYNGFEVLQHYGDFENGPIERETESQVLICGLRANWPG